MQGKGEDCVKKLKAERGLDRVLLFFREQTLDRETLLHDLDLAEQRQHVHEVVQGARAKALEEEEVETVRKVAFQKGRLVGEEQERQIKEREERALRENQLQESIKGNPSTYNYKASQFGSVTFSLG